ncbi:MAG TPA: ribonuclease P protein component [Chloroflexota bacterium]|nr:ribonuclease P protein component [Chloroflexota bacterium]
MKREHRLRSPADFARVREASARVWTHPLVVLYVAPNDLARTRVGITVSGHVGKAVVRNKVKRRLREALRLRFASLTAGQDLVVIARPRSATAAWVELDAALQTVLSRAGAIAAPVAGV